MDAEQIRGLKSMLARYLKQFDGCFARKDTRAHLSVYVEGQLSDLDAKSVEPIAVHAGVAPRTLQEFLAHYRWGEDRVRDRLEDLMGLLNTLLVWSGIQDNGSPEPAPIILNNNWYLLTLEFYIRCF